MIFGIICFIGGYYVGTNYGLNHKLVIDKTGIALGEWKVINANNGKFTVAGYDVYIRENRESLPPPSYFTILKNLTWFSNNDKKEE